MKRLGTILPRLFYLAVFISNMLCAVEFIVNPEAFIYSYEVNGSLGGEAAIRGLGVTFAMWNVTYPLFIINPRKNKPLGIIIIVQQVVGLVGELFIRSTLPAGLTRLPGSIMRFVWFDAGGLILLAAGFVILCISGKNPRQSHY